MGQKLIPKLLGFGVICLRLFKSLTVGRDSTRWHYTLIADQTSIQFKWTACLRNMKLNQGETLIFVT